MNQMARPEPAQPLTLLPRPTPRQRLTGEIKRLAAAHGLSINAVTTAEAFPEAYSR